MASTSETGHAKNVANFQVLIEFVTGYGVTYNPSKSSLRITQLQTAKTAAETALTEVIAKNTSYNNRVNERGIAFSGLKVLSTRLVNALQSTDASTASINDAKGFNRKIQGKKAATSPIAVSPDAEAPKTISSSQQSYDQLIQHLAGLKSVLEQEPSYAPNETDLQVNTIQNQLEDLTAKNTAVATAYANVSNARIARNEQLYKNDNNIFETAAEVKKYVKSVFGANSPQFNQVSGVKFTKGK